MIEDLFKAVANGDIHGIKTAVSSGCDVNTIQRVYYNGALFTNKVIDVNYKVSPLHLAILHGHMNTIKTLIELGANVNLLAPDIPSPLLFALDKKAYVIAELLIALGAIEGKEAFEAIIPKRNFCMEASDAILNRQIEVLDYLLKNYAFTPEQKVNFLIRAVRFFNVPAATLLIVCYKVAPAEVRDGSRSLINIALEGNPSAQGKISIALLELLLRHDCLISSIDLYDILRKHDFSTLECIARHSSNLSLVLHDADLTHLDYQSLSLLLNNGLNPDQHRYVGKYLISKHESFRGPLLCNYISAVPEDQERYNMAQLLIKNSRSLDFREPVSCGGKSFMHLAGDLGLVTLLHEHGLSLDIKDTRGHTALYYAKDTAFAEGLVKLGADIKEIDPSSFVVEDSAYLQQQLEQAGIKIDTSFVKAIHVIAKSKSTEGLTLDFDINGKRDENGLSILHYIVLYKRHDILSLLLEHCTKNKIVLRFDTQDNEGRTPLHYAVNDAKNIDMVARLRLIDKQLNLSLTGIEDKQFCTPENWISRRLSPYNGNTPIMWGEAPQKSGLSRLLSSKVHTDPFDEVWDTLRYGSSSFTQPESDKKYILMVDPSKIPEPLPAIKMTKSSTTDYNSRFFQNDCSSNQSRILPVSIQNQSGPHKKELFEDIRKRLCSLLQLPIDGVNTVYFINILERYEINMAKNCSKKEIQSYLEKLDQHNIKYELMEPLMIGRVCTGPAKILIPCKNPEVFLSHLQEQSEPCIPALD